MSNNDGDAEVQARISADVEAPDKLVYGLTFRQIAILAVAAVLFYGLAQLLRPVVPMVVLAATGTIFAGLAFGLAVGRRDGQSLDRWLLAAWRYRRSAKALTDTPAVPGLPGWAPQTSGRQVVPAPLRLPAHAVDDDGQIATGSGAAAIVATTTVNLGLRTSREQAGLVDGFGRWLNSLTTGTQVVVSAHPVDLGSRAEQLRRNTGRLPHPALAAACADHAAFLDDLARRRDPLRRQVLVVTTTALGETDPRAARRRADDTAHALAALGVTARPLDAGGVGAALAAAVDRFRPALTGARATAETPITARTDRSSR